MPIGARNGPLIVSRGCALAVSRGCKARCARQERGRRARSQPTMRSLQLQAALTEYIEAAAVQLHAEIADGAEVPFELEQQSARRGSRGPSLYCYRPLTARFIDERLPALEHLPVHTEAARLLTDFAGLDRYLVSVGMDGGGRPS